MSAGLRRDLDHMLVDIRHCALCADTLPLGPRPVVRASINAPILIAGQAPGTKVHQTGVPFDDPSGDRLRGWLGVDRAGFYNADHFSIVPMGFCYPGKMASGRGDMPPDPRCQKAWHGRLLPLLKGRRLTLVIGRYAINYHLKGRVKKGEALKDIVARYSDFMPDYLPLPHPSPRNLMWFKKHPWFENEIVPALKERVMHLLRGE